MVDHINVLEPKAPLPFDDEKHNIRNIRLSFLYFTWSQPIISKI